MFLLREELLANDMVLEFIMIITQKVIYVNYMQWNK